jgi:hypothetical protein
LTPLVLFIFFLALLGILIGFGLFLGTEETEGLEDSPDENDSDEDGSEDNDTGSDSPDKMDDEPEQPEFEGELDDSDLDSSKETDADTDTSAPDESNEGTDSESEQASDELRPERNLLRSPDEEYELNPFDELELDPEEQSFYEDSEDPASSSEDLISAVDWLVDANTEAIHQHDARESLLDSLRSFIQMPRARGAEVVADTRWRELSPNLSRLIGERYLVMALGLSCWGQIKMHGHRQAFLALMGNTWSNDNLEQPLLYQCMGRLGLLTATDLSSIAKELRPRIPGRTPRSDDPPLKQLAHYNALIFAVSTGGVYPFPKSDKGLSRLWHWDEHNPPLANPLHLRPVLYALWLYYLTAGTASEAANDFGAMLGNWWNEQEPTSGFFEEHPGVWEAILLTAWVTLSDQPLIWEQLIERYDEMNFDHSALESISEQFFEWSESFNETGKEPEPAPDRQSLPPQEWIRPLPSDLLRDLSGPSFDYSKDWCEMLSDPSPPNLQQLE